MFESWMHDVRLVCRGLLRAKGFTLAAVLTLSVGMAGVTAMFALIQGVLLRPLPMLEPDRIVTVTKELRAPGPAGAARLPFTAAEVALIRNDATHVFAGVAAVGYNEPTQLEVADEVSESYITTARVGGDFFNVLGVRPILGRALNRSDDTAGSEGVLVITHDLWQRRYGGARDVLGRRVTIGEQRFAIVGVMPPDVEYPRGVEAWMTVEARRTLTSHPTFQEATRNELEVIARLSPGVSVPQAASALAVLAPHLAATAPAGAPTMATASVVRPITDVVVGDVRSGMRVLFGAVALVLLVASANVANLLLVRGEVRRPEMALRTALGATRGRLARQIISESLVLSILAGIVGLAATWASIQASIAMAPEGLPRMEAIRIDGGVVLFVMALTLLTTILAALVPAFVAGRIDLVSYMQGGGRAGTRGTTRGRAVLVAAQVALAVTVVAAAGLVARSLVRLQTTGAELGADRLVLVSLALPQDRYADRARLYQFLADVVTRLEATATVAAATAINVAPFSGVGWDVPTVTAEGQNAAQVAANGSLNLEAIQPGYFNTFGVAVRGRTFDARDRGDTQNVAIVSEEAAQRLWPGQDAIGKRLKLGDLNSKDNWRIVVGVAAQTRYRELRTPRPTLYVPDTQLIVTAQSLVVRSTAPLPQIVDAVREQVRATDPAVRVPRIAPFGQLLREPLARPRFYTFVLVVFGVSALLLSAIGLYAVIAASVRQRYAEIGVRLALGATPADVRRMVVGQGMQLAMIGAGTGLALALGVTQFMRGLLYEVNPLDPASLLTATLLLLGAAAVSCYLPARTAARMDPLAALRE